MGVYGGISPVLPLLTRFGEILTQNLAGVL
jgi:hypothetical protein